VHFSPLAILFSRSTRGRKGVERSRGKHYGNEPPVLHDIHTPQRRDVIEKTSEIVLGITCGYLF
jgi:hypothetical protein